jgi:hypothetical protein
MSYVHTLTGYIDNRKKSSHTEATVEVLMEQKSQNFVAGMDTYSFPFISLGDMGLTIWQAEQTLGMLCNWSYSATTWNNT